MRHNKGGKYEEETGGVHDFLRYPGVPFGRNQGRRDGGGVMKRVVTALRTIYFLADIAFRSVTGRRFADEEE